MLLLRCVSQFIQITAITEAVVKAAAAEEWAIHIISDKYYPDTKGIYGAVKGKNK